MSQHHAFYDFTTQAISEHIILGWRKKCRTCLNSLLYSTTLKIHLISWSSACAILDLKLRNTNKTLIRFYSRNFSAGGSRKLKRHFIKSPLILYLFYAIAPLKTKVNFVKVRHYAIGKYWHSKEKWLVKLSLFERFPRREVLEEDKFYLPQNVNTCRLRRQTTESTCINPS